jgi:NADH-quinone oxidoreductase subunit G
MPRQHEAVNETWICDKGRFAYHYAESDERITTPMIRKDGQLTSVSWDEALEAVADRFRKAGSGLLTLASGRLSNEDLFNIRKMTAGAGGKTALYTTMGGGDLIPMVGVGQGTNFSEMGDDTAILVVGCDLQEEAPIWWLRVKQAADRGSKLIVLNPRTTRLDKYAQHYVHYGYGEQTTALLSMINFLSPESLDLQGEGGKFSSNVDLQAAAEVFAQAENGIIIFGSEGTGWQDTQVLAQGCANLLIATNHVGRANNGLIGVWQRVNDQGAWDMGFRPVEDMHDAMRSASALYVVAADPAGDNPKMAEATDFLVVQDIFLTDTAKLADVVLPAKTFIEREGSYTSGERRAQRYYPAVPARSECLADFEIAGRLGKSLGLELEDRSASKVMTQIAREIPDYAEITYIKLAEVSEQWPLVGRGDLYYGGTTYENLQGLGVQLAPAAQRGESPNVARAQPAPVQRSAGLTAVPVTRLYDRGQTVLPSELLQSRIHQPYIMVNPQDAKELDLPSSSTVQVNMNGTATLVNLRIDVTVPEGFVLVPRSFGIPIFAPSTIEIQLSEPVTV